MPSTAAVGWKACRGDQASRPQGQEYAVVSAPVEMSVTGARTHIMFVPAGPAAATELRLTIATILELGDVDPIPGPWMFRIPL